MSRLLRTLWPLVLVLVFVVGACGTSADDAAAEATSEPPPEVVELIEAYLASWESHDETAIRGLVADGFVLHEYWYEADTGEPTEVIIDDVDGLVIQGFRYSWENDVVGDWAVSGDGPWTVRVRELWETGSDRLDGVATYTVVDENGALRIARHSWAGFVWFESPFEQEG